MWIANAIKFYLGKNLVLKWEIGRLFSNLLKKNVNSKQKIYIYCTKRQIFKYKINLSLKQYKK